MDAAECANYIDYLSLSLSLSASASFSCSEKNGANACARLNFSHHRASRPTLPALDASTLSPLILSRFRGAHRKLPIDTVANRFRASALDGRKEEEESARKERARGLSARRELNRVHMSPKRACQHGWRSASRGISGGASICRSPLI